MKQKHMCCGQKAPRVKLKGERGNEAFHYLCSEHWNKITGSWNQRWKERETILSPSLYRSGIYSTQEDVSNDTLDLGPEACYLRMSDTACAGAFSLCTLKAPNLFTVHCMPFCILLFEELIPALEDHSSFTHKIMHLSLQNVQLLMTVPLQTRGFLSIWFSITVCTETSSWFLLILLKMGKCRGYKNLYEEKYGIKFLLFFSSFSRPTFQLLFSWHMEAHAKLPRCFSMTCFHKLTFLDHIFICLF